MKPALQAVLGVVFANRATFITKICFTQVSVFVVNLYGGGNKTYNPRFICYSISDALSKSSFSRRRRRKRKRKRRRRGKRQCKQ